MNRIILIPCVIALLLFSREAFAQPGNQNFSKVWVQGEGLTFTTTFETGKSPDNKIIGPANFLYFVGGNSNICDSLGNPLLISDGYNLYDKNLNIIDGGSHLAPNRIFRFNDGWSIYSQSSIILPFSNGKYRLITPTASDDSCIYNWEKIHNGAFFDLLLYDEVDMNANGGAGKVTKQMVPMLQNTRLTKTQMMACRHGDGKSWWLFKHAADTNLIYKFLLTDDKIYGPYLQGFTGNPFHGGSWDYAAQSAFSKDGTKYATPLQGHGKVFVADFDRCSGNLANPKVYKVPVRPFGNLAFPAELDSSTCGLCFSPNGKYLYVAGYNNVQQLDLQNASSPSGWTWLSNADTTWDQFQEYNNIYPGPDGKLYIGNWNGLGGQMSVINNPDKGGTAAEFCPKCLRFPNFLLDTVYRFIGVVSPPCMPNYSLGPTSPICYPLGVDAPQVYEVSFSLYPNPAKDIITVEHSEAGELSLYDMTGRLVLSYHLQTQGGKRSLSVEQLPAGVYQYLFTARSGGRVIGKLVVAH